MFALFCVLPLRVSKSTLPLKPECVAPWCPHPRAAAPGSATAVPVSTKFLLEWVRAGGCRFVFHVSQMNYP